MVVFHRPDFEEGKITSEHDDDNFTEKFTDNITEAQKVILQTITLYNSITQQKLSEIVGISRRSIIENMSKLKDMGLLKRIGTDRRGYWEVQKVTKKRGEE